MSAARFRVYPKDFAYTRLTGQRTRAESSVANELDPLCAISWPRAFISENSPGFSMCAERGGFLKFAKVLSSFSMFFGEQGREWNVIAAYPA